MPKLGDLLKAKNPYSGQTINLADVGSLFSLVVGAAVVGLSFRYGGILTDKIMSYFQKPLTTAKSVQPEKITLN